MWKIKWNRELVLPLSIKLLTKIIPIPLYLFTGLINRLGCNFLQAFITK